MIPQNALLTGIAPLAESYDAFILDLWGVIHDGQQLYPGVVECLSALREAGKRVVFLSNAPRRARVAGAMLDRLGVAHTLYDQLITSGETAYHFLARPGMNAEPVPYFYMGLEKDRNVLAGLHYREVDAPEDAEFILLTHSYTDNQPLEELTPLLERGLASALPLICINPDKEIMRLTGEVIYCAGVIAAEYEKRGGLVQYFGKPHLAVYEACLELFPGIDRKKIIAVGDNLATDIKGAHDFGLDNALITGGVLRREMGEPGSEVYRAKAYMMMNELECPPTYILPAFNW